MQKEKFCCQVCCSEFTKVSVFKFHLTSFVHRQNFDKVYSNAHFIREKWSYTPHIFYKCLGFTHTRPILGLSQMTLCFSSEKRNGFYLCHVCEQMFPLSNVVNHVSSADHYNNYFAYIHPNALNFAWMPSSCFLQLYNNNNIKKEQEKTGIGALQLLHLPLTIEKECEERTYREVMILFHQNKLLSDMFKEKNRMSIQTYKDDPNRKHPLLGLQNIVECVSMYEMRHYLCTLCGLHVSSSMIIRHLLSFDHLFCYFNKWHPSTLMAKECYRNYNHDFANMLTDFAKQSEELDGLADIQQVKLEPCQVFSVIKLGFKEALSKIESITKKSNWIPMIKPGIKLEPTSSGSGKQPTKGKGERNPEPCTSGSSTSLQNAGEPSVSSAAPSYSLLCQNCSRTFATNTPYINHLFLGGHQEKFRKKFGQAGQWKSKLLLYKNFTKQDHSCVGMSLVITILSHQHGTEPVHVCFACEAVFLSGSLKQHVDSLRHFVQSLMYQNPWRLPFAWKIGLDHNSLKLKACKEAEERGPNQKILRILDVPSNRFPDGAPLTFSNVMEKLDRFHSLLMRDVPRCETFSKLQDNDRFPLLGRNFLVKYGQPAHGWKFLCLLCQLTLSADEYAGHVFNWGHVVTFLDKYHPGSLDVHNTNEELLLDLAKQAARIHRVSNEQVIVCDQRICEVSDYDTKVKLLTAQMAKDNKGSLMPWITPKMKLVPRQRQTQGKDLSLNTKATNESNVVENIQSIKPSEKITDGLQSATQLPRIQTKETMEISQVPIQQEIKTAEDEFPNLSASALKRPRCLSDMDTSEIEDVDPKRMRPSATEEREEKSNVQNIDVTGQCNSSDTSVANSVPHHGWMLWSHVQKKIREPLIGLSAIYECVCNDHRPIYLCECCGLIFKEQLIAGHLSETGHYKNYLGMVGENPLPHGKTYKEDMSKLAFYWERSKGYGEAQVVELTPGEFNKLGQTSEYHKALRIVKNHLASQTNNITCVDTTTANTQNTPQQDVQMDIDPEPVTAPAKTNISSKTETNSKSNPEIFMTRPQSPEKTTTTTASCSLTSTLTITATTPTIHSLSEDTTLNTGDKTPTVKPNNPTTSVVPEAESKTASISNKLEYIVSTSSTTDTPKFMNAKSANQNMSKPAMTLLAPPSPNGIKICKKSSAENMPSSPCDNDDVTPNNPTTALSLLEDSTKVTDRPPISNDTISNAAKDAPNPQDALTIQIHSIPTDLLYAIKAETSTESSQTKPPAKSRPKTMDNHTKNKEKKLKLNVNAATRITKDGPVHKIDSFTATTPESDPQTPTTEISVKATSTTHKIGVDHLLKVSCKDSTHTYCFVCSVKLEKSDHLTSTSHQINCVKAKYPSWSSKPNGSKLSDMVSRIADDEKALKIECKKIEVASDVYKELKSLPDDKAIEKVKGIIKKKSSKNPAQRRPSAQTSQVTTSSNFSVRPSGKANGLTKPQAKSIAEPINNVPVSFPNPTVQKPMSKVAPRIIKGSTTDELSNLFHIVKVMDRPVIGLSFVWECRVVPPKLPTFYLCESCRQTISVNEIYEHMASAEHRWKYIMRQYPRFMCWIEEELIPEMIDELTNDIAGWVFCREELMDAQPVLLSEECFEWVRTAPFVEALSVVQRIKQEKKTTTLPLIVTSQNDLPNQMEMPLLEEDRRTTDSDHAIHGLDGNAAYANAESRPSPTEYLPFPHITHRPPCSIFSHQEISEPENEARSDISTPLSQISEPLVSQPPSTSPPEIPEHIPSCSVNQNMPASPKYENQEDVEPENTVRADVSTPLSHDSAVGSSDPIDSIGTTTLKDTSYNTTHEPEIKPKLPSVHEICSSAEISKHNENVFKPIQEENVALEGSPRHSSVLTGESTSLASSTAKCNDTTSPDLDADMFQMLINLIKQSKPSVNLEESCTTVCDAPRPTRWDLGPPPNTKSEAAPKDYSMTYSEDMMSTVITSESSVSKENTEKPTAVTIELSKEIHKMTSSSEITVIQQDEEIKTEEIRIQEVKMKNSQGAMQTSQPKIQVSHNEDQLKEFNIDGGVQTSEQKQELQVTSDTPVVPSQCPTPQSQDQMQREPSNTGTVQIQQTQVQVQQSQVVQLQPQIEVAPSQHAIQQTQGHPQQRPIYARVTTRPQNTLYLPGDGDDGQNISVNTSFQMSQGLPVNTITSNSLVLTGYGHFVETSYPTTGNIGSILNIPVEDIYSHSSAYPSHVHHQLHAQQCYTLMQPFIQNVPNPGASEWFNTNGQLQPGAQTHVAWSNGAAAGTTNVVYSNAVQFNTASLQSYTNVQEYNRVSMQNHSHTQSFPGSMDSQSFPHRQ